MQLLQFISTKEGYKFTEQQIKNCSLRFGINLEDLSSAVFFRLAKHIEKGTVMNDLNHTQCTIKIIARNMCFDIMKKKAAYDVHSMDNEMLERNVPDTVSQNGDAKETLKIIDRAIRTRWNTMPVYIEVYERCILGNDHGTTVCTELNINRNTLSAVMSYIRKFAKSTYAAL